MSHPSRRWHGRLRSKTACRGGARRFEQLEAIVQTTVLNSHANTVAD